MSTYIVRVAPIEGAIAGTIEEPGEQPKPFRTPAELVTILVGWEQAGDADHAGNGSGSTSMSPIRDT